jgi:hypothetical protein
MQCINNCDLTLTHKTSSVKGIPKRLTVLKNWIGSQRHGEAIWQSLSNGGSLLDIISISSRAPLNSARSARIFRGARAAKGKLDSHVWSETVFLPAADAACDGLKGLIAQPFFAVARVVAIALLELTQESGHAQRAKRIGQRLAAGGSQFSGI